MTILDRDHSLLDMLRGECRPRRPTRLAVLGALVSAALGCVQEGSRSGSGSGEDVDSGFEPGASAGAFSFEGATQGGRDLGDSNAALVGFSAILGPDFTSAGVGGLRYADSGALVVSGVSGVVKKALLYWHGPTATSNPSVNARIQLNGVGFTGIQIGSSSSNNWSGYINSQAYAADVTAVVRGNGTYVVTGYQRDSRATTNGASLLVFYDNGFAWNDRNVTLLRGNDSMCPNSYDGPGFSATASRLWYEAGPATVQLHVADGQQYVDLALLANNQPLASMGHIFDGDSVPWAGSGIFDQNSLWDIKEFNIASYLGPGASSLALRTGPPIGGTIDCTALVVAAIDLPAKCPWGGVYDPDGFGGAGSCRYAFDGIGRARAARYAIGWATNACPLFCAYQFAPHVPGTKSCVNDATDCANFVSQALLYGGLPMTKGWSCDYSDDPELCVRKNYENRPAGWSGAARTFSGGGMPKYYGYNVVGAYDTYQITTGAAGSEGIPPGWTPEDTQELSDKLPSNERQNVIDTGALLGELGIAQGDIMVTNGHDYTTAHVLLVVGWGPYVRPGWENLSRVDMSALSPTWKRNKVPYVVDHGLHQIYAFEHPDHPDASAIAGPKPYYAFRWNPDGSVGPNEYRHFIKIPDELVVPYDEVLLPSGTEALRRRMDTVCPVP